MKTIVITSGYFNPIHPWHIECLELCKELWDELRVIVNNDEQAKLKTGKDTVFQDQDFRMKIVSSLKVVDEVYLSIDTDGSVCESIKWITKKIKEKYWEDVIIYFWKWGDRFSWNIPEVQICKDLWIEIKDWLWAKTHNSSDYRSKAAKN
jgi:cytidyltransferase-like protein